MRHLVSTNFSFIWSEEFDQGVELLATAGIDRIELTLSLPHIDLRDPVEEVASRVSRIAAQHGISFSSVNPVDLNLISANGAIADVSCLQYKRAIDVAEALEAPVVVVVPGRFNALSAMDFAVARDAFHQRFEALVEHVDNKNVLLGVETTPFGFLETPKDLLAEIDRYNPYNVGITVDAANLHFVNADIESEISQAADRTVLAHISDTNQVKFQHTYLGEGTVPVEDFIALLARVGYQGDIVYELVVPQLDFPRLEADLRRLSYAMAPARLPQG